MRFRVVASVLIAGLTWACVPDSDVRNVRVDEANRVALYQAIQEGNELTGEEVKLLDAYLARKGQPGQLPAGLTIGEMLAEQRGFEAHDAAPPSERPTAVAAIGEAAATSAAPAPPAAPAAPQAPAPAPASSGAPAPASSGPAAAPPPQVAAPPPPPSAPIREPVQRRRPRSAKLEAGTLIEVYLDQALSSKTSRPGDRFEATLGDDLMVGRLLLAPKGSRVIGRVADAKAAGKVKGLARLSLTLAELEVDEQRHRLETDRILFEAHSTKKEDAKKVGIGAGAGAVIGAIAGGKKGAAIGTAVGAATGGAAVLATSGDEVELPAEQALSFELEEALDLPALNR
jgi:hypothetical protein